jgi:2-dehydro-3-deoxygalactonokinase
MTAAFIGIDWGTTHRRALVIGAQGETIAEHADAEGALACVGRFRASLEALLLRWPEVGPDVPVVMSGMIGSASGWQPVPYLGGDTPVGELARALVRVSDAPVGRRWFIVPGWCLRDDATGEVDVMRGEETQLFGAIHLARARGAKGEGLTDGLYALPGTHSKWARLRAGRVVELRTYMTGELFALLGERGTLASVMHGVRRSVAPDDPAFEAGVRAMCGTSPPALSHALFGARARVVTQSLAPQAAVAYVSGLLLGAEWADARRHPSPDEPVRLIGAPALVALHAACAAQFGRHVEVLAVEAVQRAAWQAFASEGVPS